MFNPSLSMTRLSAGSGIDAVETRVRQLETMIQSEQSGSPAQKQSTSVTAPDFRNFLGEVAPPPKVTPLPEIQKNIQGALNPIIEKYAAQYQLDPALINAVIHQESGFNPNAVSKSGAQGLMQLMPNTAKALGVQNAFDPAQNIAGGTRHLAGLLKRYQGNIPLALAAYNAGGSAVDKHQGIPPYSETQQYVRRVLTAYLSQRRPT